MRISRTTNLIVEIGQVIAYHKQISPKIILAFSKVNTIFFLIVKFSHPIINE